jgi:hypothetical protein
MLTFREFLREFFLLEGGGKNMFKEPSAGEPILVNSIPKDDRTGNLTGEPIGTEHRKSIHNGLLAFGEAVKSRTGQNPFGENGIRYGGSSGPIMDPKTTEEDINRWKREKQKDVDVFAIHAHKDGSELQKHLHGMFKNDGKDNRFGDIELKSMAKHGGRLGEGTSITSALFHYHPTGENFQVDLLHTPEGPKGEAMDPAYIVANSSHREDLDHRIKGAHKNALAEAAVSVLGGTHHPDKKVVSAQTGNQVKDEDVERGGAKKLSLDKGRVYNRYIKHKNGGLVKVRQADRNAEDGQRQHEWLSKRLGRRISEDASFIEIHRALHEALASGHITQDHMNQIRERYNKKIKDRGELRLGTFEERDAAVKGSK